MSSVPPTKKPRSDPARAVVPRKLPRKAAVGRTAQTTAATAPTETHHALPATAAAQMDWPNPPAQALAPPAVEVAERAASVPPQALAGALGERAPNWPEPAAVGTFTPKPTHKSAKPPKLKKPKPVRDSFTMPKGEYQLIDLLKGRAAARQRHVKKSEILRAGIIALADMTDAQLFAALDAVPVIKTGRPRADHTAD